MEDGLLEDARDGSGRNRKIEIVTHAYSGHHDQYRAFVALQAESLIRYPLPNRHQVSYSVVTCIRDFEILGTLALFSKRLDEAGVCLNVMAMDKGHLHRRCIGRNRICLGTNADVLWFCDVDYWFGEGCLKSVVDQVYADDGLKTPGRYFCHREHSDGDAMVRKVIYMLDHPTDVTDPLKGFAIDTREFFERKNKTAIGGLQIVGREAVQGLNGEGRAKGYLNATEWMNPREGDDLAKGVQRTKDDVAWRKRYKMKTERIKIANLYRFRHTEAGRDIEADSVV